MFDFLCYVAVGAIAYWWLTRKKERDPMRRAAVRSTRQRFTNFFSAQCVFCGHHIDYHIRPDGGCMVEVPDVNNPGAQGVCCCGGFR